MDGVKASVGAYICLMDGDNIMAEDWISRSVTYAQAHARACVYHPSYVVTFDAKNLFFRPNATLNYQDVINRLFVENRWDTFSTARREVFLNTPYVPANLVEGFGFEDWHWSCETLANGVEHVIVPETILFKRERASDSHGQKHIAQSCTLMKTKLFDLNEISRIKKLRIHKVNSFNRTNSLKEVRTCRTRSQNSQVIIAKTLSNVLIALYETIHVILWPFLRLLRKINPKVGVFLSAVSSAIRQFLSVTSKELEIVNDFSSDIVKSWKLVNKYDRKIFPSKYLLKFIPEHIPLSDSQPFELYYKILRKIGGGRVDYLFFLPWLSKGGADLEAINFINTLLDINPEYKIVVLTTTHCDSNWLYRLRDSIITFEIGKQPCGQNLDLLKLLIVRLIVQLEPRVVHNINSKEFYETMMSYGKVISKISKVYTHIFCEDRSVEGELSGYMHLYVPNLIHQFQHIIADNQSVVDMMVKLYGFDYSKFSVAYQPAKSQFAFGKTPKREGLNVLWAGRLDRQKRPDILFRIAQAIQNPSIHIDMFGSAVLDKFDLTNQILPANLTYCGGFNDFRGVARNGYDVYLLTSEWEGLPNTILEAIASGLIVVAPDVGGVREIISNKRTGFLVKDYDNVAEYVNVLEEIIGLRDPEKIVKSGQRLISERHSEESFKKAVKRIPDYVV